MTTGILLAAGNSSRFGSDKLLHPLPDGTPIAIAAARNLIAAIPTSLAVVHPDNYALVDLLSTEGLTIVACRTAIEGMGASIACGVRASSHAKGWIIALADMPFVRPSTLLEISRQIEQGAPLAAPVYRGQRGHPVGFGHEFFEELASLSGDQGARGIVSAQAERATLLACEDPGILADIDSTDDIARHRDLMQV
jgi:molybdenum cofactor cytidylyltransferase